MRVSRLFVASRPWCRFEVAQDRFAERSSATTFPVPGFAEELGFEVLCLFGGEGSLSTLSAAAYTDPGDITGDREAVGFAGGFVDAGFDPQSAGLWHRWTSLG